MEAWARDYADPFNCYGAPPAQVQFPPSPTTGAGGGSPRTGTQTGRARPAEALKRHIERRQPARVGHRSRRTQIGLLRRRNTVLKDGGRRVLLTLNGIQITGQEEVRVGMEVTGPEPQTTARKTYRPVPAVVVVKGLHNMARTAQGFHAHTMQLLGNLQDENGVQVAVACNQHSKGIM